MSPERDQAGVGWPQAGQQCGGLDFVQERFPNTSPGDFESL